MSAAISSSIFTNKYEMLKTLGTGTSSKVVLAKDKKTNELFACKIVKKSSNPKIENGLKREITSLQLLDHPNIIRLIEVIEETSKTILVTAYETASQDLFNYISRNEVSVKTQAKIFGQIVLGLEHCHENKITHRDLKLENILIDKNFKIKLIDFGISRDIPQNSLVSTSCGSPQYAAPEVIKGENYYPDRNDVWSLGVILFAIATNSLPFDDEHIPTLFRIIKSGKYYIPSYVDPDINDLINRMLVVDSSKRITLDEIKKNPLFQRYPLPKYDSTNKKQKEEGKEEEKKSTP